MIVLARIALAAVLVAAVAIVVVTTVSWFWPDPYQSEPQAPSPKDNHRVPRRS